MRNPFKKSLSFSEAVSVMEKKEKVTRDNELWKSKGLHLAIEDDAVYIFNSDGGKSIFTPSEEDIKADDWITV